MVLEPASYGEECISFTAVVVFKLSFLSFHVKGFAVLSQPLKGRPVNLSFFIPLPAGLVEIKQREYGLSC